MSQTLAGVHVVSPAPRDAWNDLLDADPLALPTQTPDWTDLVCRALDAVDTSRLYEYGDGRRMVLPVVARRRAGLPITEESLPYGFGYGGPVVPGGKPTERDRRTVLADLAQRPVARGTLAPNPLLSERWSSGAAQRAVRIGRLSHVLDLEGGFDVAFARYRSETRRNIRKAQKQPLDVRVVRDESLVDVFAGLNARSVDRWAHQRGQPLWVARLVERHRDRVGRLRLAMAGNGGECVGWTAHLDGVPVAAYVAVLDRRSAWCWMSAMDKELSDRTRAGALLQSLAIEHACAARARWFHLGESDPGSGVARFKEGFGAVPVPQSVFHFERLPLTAAEGTLRAAGARLFRRGSAPRGPEPS